MSDAAVARALIRAAELEQLLSAERVLAQARAQAEAIVAAAHAQARRIREDCEHSLAGEAASERLRGYAEGRQRAADEHASRCLEHQAQMAQAWREQDVKTVDLVTGILAKVLREEDIGAGFFARIAERVVREIQDGRPLVMRVAPSQLETARRCLREAWDGTHVPRFVDLQPAAEVPLGTCTIETSTQSIDASLDTQLASIRRLLLRAAERR